MNEGVQLMSPARCRRPPQTTLWQAIASMGQPLNFFVDHARKYPEAFYSRLGAFSAHVIHHPDLIREVLITHAKNYEKFEKYRYLRLIGGNGLVTNEGESWQAQRKLVSPAFHRTALERAVGVMVDEAYAAVSAAGNHIQSFDVGTAMGELAVGIAARSLFSTSVKPHIPIIRRELDRSQKLGNILLRIPLPLYRCVPYLPVFRQICTSAQRLRTIVWSLIAARRDEPSPPGDLLDVLMAARDDLTLTGMNDTQLQDEVLTLLLAGHETSLLGLTWAFELLARHPLAQARVREEAQAVMHPGFTYADLERLSWTKAVVHEVLRLYPPAYIIGRSARGRDCLGNYDIFAGENVLINIYGLQRHPDYWADPDVFFPERMLDSNSTDPGRLVYLPFGAGPRACIGARFAMYELQIVLAVFALHFEFSAIDAVAARPSPQITLKTSRPVRLRLLPLRKQD